MICKVCGRLFGVEFVDGEIEKEEWCEECWMWYVYEVLRNEYKWY